MSFDYTHLAAITAVADVDRFVVIGDGVMKNAAYTLTATTMPETGTARKITITHATVAAGTDTLGTVTVVGMNLSGQTITEVCVPIHDATTTYTKWFASIVSITGAGWAIVGGNDTITVGCAAVAIVAQAGGGTFRGVIVNTTAAGTITIKDAKGTIAIIKASVAEGFIGPYDVAFSGYLDVALAAASDITVLHSGSLPTDYAMS